MSSNEMKMKEEKNNKIESQESIAYEIARTVKLK